MIFACVIAFVISLGSLRLLRRGRGAHQALDPAGALGALRDDLDDHRSTCSCSAAREETGETHWGKLPAVSQYVLIFIAVTFTWLMGLMGYVRSGLRQHWHVYGVMRDHSLDAFTPTLGFATQVVSVTVVDLLLAHRRSCSGSRACTTSPTGVTDR